nr:MAG TPA: hypothetical protein [Caudoviricetes sp.]
MEIRCILVEIELTFKRYVLYRRTTSRLFRAFFYYIKWFKSLNRAIIYTAVVNILYSTIRLIV